MEKLWSFWEHHQKFLQTSYPGLKPLRWEREARTFCSQTGRPLNHFLKEIRRGVPLEYIAGHAYFYKSEFCISPQVFIPRSETEILVEKAVAICHQKRPTAWPLKIADVGTGCGAIILSLSLDFSFALDASAIDCSPAALDLCRKNYLKLKPAIHRQTQMCFLLGESALSSVRQAAAPDRIQPTLYQAAGGRPQSSSSSFSI